MSLRSMKLLSGKMLAGLIIAICFACGVSAYGQLGTGQITGIVRDPTGASISGAQVAAHQVDTGAVSNTTTSAEGLFSFPSLPVGAYSIVVNSPGFAKYTVNQIVLTVNQVYNSQVTLQVAKTGETVIVEASNAPPVEATESVIQSLVGETVVNELPLNGRNPADLLATVSGVTNAGLNPPVGGFGIVNLEANNPAESAPSVHGVRPGNTYFSLDGASNLDPYGVVGGPFPNPDATQEFSVVTGTYGAGYPSAASGAVNIVTRSGTNQIHGSVFEYLRNGFFNAHNALTPLFPDTLKRNMFGGAAGGPLLKEKLFVFGAYQGTRIANEQGSIVFVPTDQQRLGNFETLETTPTQYTIPVSSVIGRLLAYIPRTTDPSGALAIKTPDDESENQFVVKSDLSLKNNRVFLRYFSDHHDVTAHGPTGSNMFNANRGYNQPYQLATLGDTYVRGNIVANSSVSYLSANSKTISVPNEMGYAALGSLNLTPGKTPGLFTVVVPGKFVYTGDGVSNSYPRSQWQGAEDVIYTHGRHQITLGASYEHAKFSLVSEDGQNPVGIYVGANNLAAHFWNNAYNDPMADFIMGVPVSLTQNDGFYFGQKANFFGAYAEDKIHASDRLTATVGLRLDPFSAYTPLNGHATCFVPDQQSTTFTNAPQGLNFPGDKGCPTAAFPSKFANFEPRAGLAYRLDSRGRSALRAGYGLYTTQLPFDTFRGFSAQPWVRSLAYSQSVNPFDPNARAISIDDVWGSLGTTNPYATGFRGPSFAPAKDIAFPTPVLVSLISSKFQPSYVQQLTLSFQQQFTDSDSLEIVWIGTAAKHLTMMYELNTPVYTPGNGPFGPLSTQGNEQQRRPLNNLGLGIVSQLGSDGNSKYSGVDITYRHSISKGITLTSAVNYSKALDDLSVFGVTGQEYNVNFPHDWRYAKSDYNQTFTWRTTGTYKSPALGDRALPVREALGSWSLSGILVVDSGQPFSVTDRHDNSMTGSGVDYVDRVAGEPVWKSGILNFAAFADNANGTFGNSGRNSVTAPGMTRVDISASKTFPIREHVSFQFRAEAFNALNHPMYDPPNAEYTSGPSAFGQYTQARDPRIMQFSGKFTF